MKFRSILILTLCTAGSALAQFLWVASNGNDTANTGKPNTCMRTTPCLTFAHAAQLEPDRVIMAVDAADYGIVNITHNTTIDGTLGGLIGAANGTGITINNPGGEVTIRNLTIVVGSGGYGIDIIAGDVHLENVLIAGNPFYGVYADGSFGNAVHLTTKNVTVTNATVAGILLYGASGSIRDSVFRGDTNGIYVQGVNGHAAVALVERCELSYNGTGLAADNNNGSGSTARVSDTVITGNTTGISATAGGQILSFRTNLLAGNITDGATAFSLSLK